MQKNGKKKNSKGAFWELSDESFYRIQSVYRYCINIIYMKLLNRASD